MRTLLLHLSDIHMSEKALGFAGRAEKIADAALSRLNSFDECHIVLTGDSANWGLKEEFAIAQSFINAVSIRIEERSGKRPIVAVCPGNHDCNLQGDQSVREALLKFAVSSQGPVTPEIVGQISSALSEYFEFQAAISPSTRPLNGWHSLLETSGIRYVILNSAVTSVLREQAGSLIMPSPRVSTQDGDGRRTVYLMHHPYNWIQQDNARELAQHAAASADLFLMGHEHVNWAQAVSELYDGSSITYLKGHVLRDTENPSNSAFQTILVDSNDGYLVSSFRWLEGRYEYWEDRSFLEPAKWPKPEGARKLSLSDDAYRELNSAGANFTHRRKAQLSLPDIFVWPSIREASAEGLPTSTGGAELSEISAERLVADYESFSEIIVIRGGEQSGKTALAKTLTIGLARRGVYPILIAASNVSSWRTRSLNDRLDATIDSMYGKSRRDDFRQLPAENKVLIIDDFDLSQVTKGYFDGLRALRAHFGKIILMLDSYPGLEVALNEFLRDECFVDAEIFDIASAGAASRLKLIEKWISIGDPDLDIDGAKVVAAKLSKVVDETLGRNLIPAVPVFILIILQRAELAQDLDTVVKSGSQGFLYEALIIQAISTKVRAANVVTCLSYLSAFAQELMRSGADHMAQVKFDSFHVKHCDRYALDLPVAKLQDQLIDAGVLEDRAGLVAFKYPFHNYYFTARALSQIDSWLLLEPEVDGLIASIHTERNANILLFLAHIKRNVQIAEKLIGKAEEMFKSFERSDLFGKNPILDQFSATTVRAILREGARDQQLAENERDLLTAEQSQQELTSMAEARLKSRLNDALAMNGAFKTLQVLGQILRNHAGEIERQEKLRMATACTELGFRVLSFMVSTVAQSGQEIIEFRAAQIRAEKPQLNEAEVAEQMENYLPIFASNLCVGTLIKIANAVGSEDLAPTLDDALGGSSTGRLLRIITKLEHFSDFPKKQLLDFHDDELRGAGFLPNNVLRRFIVRRLYLYPSREELRRDVLEKFKIRALPFKFLTQHKAGGD